MDEPTIATPILIGHAESKRALAVFAHLRRIIETVTRDDRVIRPIQMDHADLLLASASMRALLFDGNPVLIDFAKMHGLEIEIECFETNIALFLLSWLVPDDLHISDYLVHALLDPTTRDKYELNKPTQQVLTFREKTGFESALRRPDILLPNAKANQEINFWFGVSDTGAPTQFITITRRRVSLTDWGKTRIGFLKDFAIDRQNLLTYVANKLGGVHYDSKRLPTKVGDLKQFNTLASAYDWESQAIMHAGLVAVAIACIELINTPIIREIITALHKFHIARQRSLLKEHPERTC